MRTIFEILLLTFIYFRITLESSDKSELVTILFALIYVISILALILFIVNFSKKKVVVMHKKLNSNINAKYITNE